MSNKLLVSAVVLSVLLSAVSLYVAVVPSLGSQTYGSLGVKLAENYNPNLRYNGGYYSALPIQTTSSVTVGSMVVGTNGTTLNRVNQGTCYFAPSATTIAASSSIAIDCQATAAVSASGESALTGITNGDVVNLTLSTTTAKSGVASFGSLVVGGASASSTAGYITVWLFNQTGTTYTWPTTGTASGTASYIVMN